MPVVGCPCSCWPTHVGAAKGTACGLAAHRHADMVLLKQGIQVWVRGCMHLRHTEVQTAMQLRYEIGQSHTCPSAIPSIKCEGVSWVIESHTPSRGASRLVSSAKSLSLSLVLA